MIILLAKYQLASDDSIKGHDKLIASVFAE